MTYNDIMHIAKSLDKDIKQRIDEAVEERMDILSSGDLTKDELAKMEECLYISLVIQEYLNSEAELLEEERDLLLAEMEEMYNEYGELLSKAKLEEKLSRKKRMALELKRIREELFNRKNRVKRVKNELQENQKNHDALKKVSSIESMKEIAKSKKDLPNPDKDMKLGVENDMGSKPNKSKEINTNDSYTKEDVERLVQQKVADNKLEDWKSDVLSRKPKTDDPDNYSTSEEYQRNVNDIISGVPGMGDNYGVKESLDGQISKNGYKLDRA